MKFIEVTSIYNKDNKYLIPMNQILFIEFRPKNPNILIKSPQFSSEVIIYLRNGNNLFVEESIPTIREFLRYHKIDLINENYLQNLYSLTESPKF